MEESRFYQIQAVIVCVCVCLYNKIISNLLYCYHPENPLSIIVGGDIGHVFVSVLAYSAFTGFYIYVDLMF